jgi:hypothetical protein
LDQHYQTKKAIPLIIVALLSSQSFIWQEGGTEHVKEIGWTGWDLNSCSSSAALFK